MADTEQTWTALQTALADNTARAISPQDLRDAIVSCLGGYAGLYVSGGAAAQSLTAVPALVTCWTDTHSERGAAASAVNDRITIGTTGDYLVTASASMTSTPAAVTDLYLYTSGVVIPGATTTYDTHGTELRAATVSTIVTLAAGALVTLYGSTTPGADVTISDATLTVKRVG